MTAWNYRVFLEVDGGLSIREAFYDEAGRVIACSEPVAVEAASITALTALLDDLRQALDQPVLTLSDLPAPQANRPRAHPGQRFSQTEVVTRLA